MGYFEPARQRWVFIKEGRVIEKKKDGTIEDHGGIKGYLENVKWEMREPKPGDTWKKHEELQIIMADESGQFVIKVQLNGGYGKAFLKIIGSADLSKEIAIVPTFTGWEMKDGKKVGGNGGMFIQQDGKAIPWFFTNNAPKGMPPPEKFTINNQDVVDYTKQTNFLKSFIESEILPKLYPRTIMDGPATQFGDEGEVVSVDAYAGEYERGPKRSVASIAHNSSGIPIPPLPGMTGRVADPLDNDGVDDLPF